MKQNQIWHETSWQAKQSVQAINYPDDTKLQATITQLKKLPPLVTLAEITRLKQTLAQAQAGDCFILQGGDCAESFSSCNATTITNKLKILLQMSLILIHGMRKPVVRVGRIAGQFAKPRSNLTEIHQGQTLPSYRGDLINGQAFDEINRIPAPERLLQGYHHAAMTLNYIRALIDGGFADLQHPQHWDLDFFGYSPLQNDYEKLVHSIEDTLAFVKSFSGLRHNSVNRIDFYTSHEALNLYYEQGLVRQENGMFYNSSTHFPWLGMRTAQLDGAHIEFLRGLANPIALKVGPSLALDELLELIDRLNPHNETGKLTLICRLGADQVQAKLPQIIKSVINAKKNVVWSCDPMHGNTHKTASGIKTRHFDDILAELRHNFSIHRTHGTHLSGVHFELTGENVTECLGGARGLSESDLHQAYESLVDPRLNYEQSLEMAMLIAKTVT
ncbi:MAG: 3-deoxy-7-phosphoheptulonate synthase class II [Pseudomonadota bacterium]